MDPIQQAVDVLAARLDRSVTLDAADGEVLAYNVQGREVDGARLEAILARRASAEVVAWERSYEPERSIVTVPANEALGLGPRLRATLRSGATIHGYLWLLEAGRPFVTDDLDVVLRAARELTALVRRPDAAYAAPRLPADAHLGRLLAEWPAVKAAGKLVDSLLGEGEMRVIVAVATSPKRGEVETLAASRAAAAERSLARLPRDDLGLRALAVRDPHVVVVAAGAPASIERCVPSVEAALHRLTSPQRRFAIGISRPVRLQRKVFVNALSEAMTTAALAASDPSLPWTVRAEAAYLYRHLGRGPLDDPLAPLARHAVLLETLETYLDCCGDVARTAERLHLHRATVYYRLNRITETLGLDFTDGLVRSDLHIALKRRRRDALE